MLKRLITTWLLLTLLALPAASNVYQVVQRTGTMSCCAGNGGHCRAAMNGCQDMAECPLQCTCVASEKQTSPGITTNRPPLPNAAAAPAATHAFAAWPNAGSSNATFRIITTADTNSYLHHTCLRI